MAKKVTQGIEVDKLDTLIDNLGVRVNIYKSTLCPNMSSMESEDHDVNCKICKNNMVDFDCFESIALFQQQDLIKQFNVQGTFHLDEVLVTFLSGISLQVFARIELLDFPEEFYELIQRQEGTDVDYLKYKACSVQGLFVIDKSGAEDVLVRYHYGTDFTLTQQGNIKWTGSRKPADRTIYTIYYKHLPIYRAVKAVHRDRFSQYNTRPETIKAPKKTINNKTFIKLPETWVLKRDYLLKRDKNTLYDPNE